MRAINQPILQTAYENLIAEHGGTLHPSDPLNARSAEFPGLVTVSG